MTFCCLKVGIYSHWGILGHLEEFFKTSKVDAALDVVIQDPQFSSLDDLMEMEDKTAFPALTGITWSSTVNIREGRALCLSPRTLFLLGLNHSVGCGCAPKC